MQQAIYSSINGINIGTGQAEKTTKTEVRRAGLGRKLTQHWDLAGVLALMASSAAYGVYALVHLGLQ